MVPVVTLGVVFILIAVRQVGRFRLAIWQIMLFGAVVVLVTGRISPGEALRAVNTDVMLFLFGVFVIGRALEESGYLENIAGRLFGRARSMDALVLLILFGMGLLSAVLMNDTLAIIGTPVMLSLAGRTGTQPRLLLFSLAFAVTIGSVTSPIGNPQNLLIALHGGVPDPFVTFLKYLLAPTLLNLLLAYLVLRLFYRGQFRLRPQVIAPAPVGDPALAKVARASLFVLVALIVARIGVVLLGLNIDFRLTYIALAAALPVLAFTPWRPGVLKRLDWATLVFFAAMFVLMQSVWDAGVFQSLIGVTKVDLTATGTVMGVSVLLSQLLSNVPLVALYLPLLTQAGVPAKGLMALAAGSTIAGNLTILGAASNVIIVQNAEKRRGVVITFRDFVLVGAPLTALNAAVYWLFSLLI